MTRSFRIQATSAVFLTFPRSTNWPQNSWIFSITPGSRKGDHTWSFSNRGPTALGESPSLALTVGWVTRARGVGLPAAVVLLGDWMGGWRCLSFAGVAVPGRAQLFQEGRGEDHRTLVSGLVHRRHPEKPVVNDDVFERVARSAGRHKFTVLPARGGGAAPVHLVA